MLRHWRARADDRTAWDWVKRFDPRFWTVNFPRPMMAAATNPGPHAVRVDLAFLRRNDLAGLIWESEDRHDHPLTQLETARDYRGCTLGFRWRTGPGVKPLDAVGGPTLTIEGRDANGAPRAWYVRLWNYAEGEPDDARVTLDFGALDGGFLLPSEADPVWAGDVDRVFVSLVPAGHDGADAPLPAPVETWVELSEVACTGEGSTIRLGDAYLPEHGLRIAGGYDDSYHLTPARLVRGWMHLGYRRVVNHYVGMSHFMALRHDPAAGGYVVDPAKPLCAPARAWHAALLAEAGAAGFETILSLSYELLAQHAPGAWVQRRADGSPGLTGWEPPSALLSPCSVPAMAWLRSVAAAFAGLARAAGQRVLFQVGEPWWWVGPDGRPSFYDAATTAAYLAETGQAAPVMHDVRGERTAVERRFLDWLGGKLAASTLAVRDAAAPDVSHLLFYAPQVLDAAAPDLRRANMPAGWARPAWDVLQLEDYTFVVAGDAAGMERGRAAVTAALGYPVAAQHYLAGFVLRPEDAAAQWPAIMAAAREAQARGVAETFVWAWPQVARDGLTAFDLGDEEAAMFDDVQFPLAIGLGAGGGPEFRTIVATAASGHESRNIGWADARLRFDAGLGVRSEADLAALVAFFRARRGPGHGFRFRDPLDHVSGAHGSEPTPGDQAIGTGDGRTTRFALVKRYGEGAGAQVRRITRPEAGSVRVTVAGVERTSGWRAEAGGWVAFDAAPAAGAAVTAGFRFDVPVRFAEDRIEMSLAGWRAGEVPAVPLVELREG